LAVTTWRPARIAASVSALAGPSLPPISSMITSASAIAAISTASSNQR